MYDCLPPFILGIKIVTFIPRQGKTVTLKLKTVKFESTTRAQSLLNATCELEQIYSAARDLLRAEMQNAAPEPLHLRLMGNRSFFEIIYSIIRVMYLFVLFCVSCLFGN